MTSPDTAALVIIPTYDERENLPLIVARTLAVATTLTGHLEILVVDDGSPDGTGEVADGLAAADPRVHVLHRSAKEGLGAAYLAGFDWALAPGRHYDTVVEMDADGSHLPEQLPRLLAGLEGPNGSDHGTDGAERADLVLGSRWVPGGRVHDWPRRRELLSRGGNAYVRHALRMPLGDATGGYRAFRGSTLRRLDLSGVESHGYCFQVDLARRVLDAGMTVREVPIDFHERTLGASKMSGSIVREALWRVTTWGAAEHLGRRSPRRVRRPAALESLPI